MSKPSTLQEVLQNLDPVLSQHTFVYVGVTNQSLLKVLGYDPVAFYKEKAGITLILRKDEADNNFLTYENEFCKIDLNAPFYFDCTGLTAIVSSALAKAGIAIRPIQTAYSRFILVETNPNTPQSSSAAPELAKSFPSLSSAKKRPPALTWVPRDEASPSCQPA